MGDGEAGEKYLQLYSNFRGYPRQGDTDNSCIKFINKSGSRGWAGIYWVNSPGHWGDKPGNAIIDASKVTFWAAGEKGGEIVEFKAEGIVGKTYRDSFEISTEKIKLSRTWKKYEISLVGKKLTNVIGAFAWVANGDENKGSLIFHIDDIRYE